MNTSRSDGISLTSKEKRSAVLNVAVLVAALGYFVDVFDLVLFSVVRNSSLSSLGYTGEALTSHGIFLLNVQMGSMLLGGIIFGVLGDKRGRISVLFGSILLYSLANIANGYVTTFNGYVICRLLAGLGLAGELGGGITLVSEILPKEVRGYATTVIATVGVSGAIVAGSIAELFDWRTAYIIGGSMGLVLLFLRVAVHESGMFKDLEGREHISRGNLLMLVNSRERLMRYLSCILIGIPIWYGVSIFVTLGPEVGSALGLTEPIKASTALIYCYIGVTVGDLVSGVLSQLLRSRRKPILLFLLILMSATAAITNIFGASASTYYWILMFAGFGIGYWAVFVTTAAEQFGTNLRSTVATTCPNFVRGAVVISTLMFESLKSMIGVIPAVQVVGLFWFLLALGALSQLHETYGKDLNFVEVD